MRVLFLAILLLTAVSYADDLDLLLDKYQSESDLSKKTKNENAGHVTVYTRDDLERMQVESLKDLLKSTRFFRYLENRTAQPDMLNTDPVFYGSKSIRVYVNNNEMVLPITGSGFIMFGDIDMDFIDHVEIYEGFPSFEFGIEPATIVIRLYTKDAKHDSGSRIKALVASHGSNKENVYTADTTENGVSYYLYANHNENNQKSYKVDGEDVKRDGRTNHFYASISKNNYKLELQALDQKQDGFLGLLPYAVPQSSKVKKTFLMLHSSSYLEDKSLTVNLSYIYTKGNYRATYQPALPAVFGGFSTMEQDSDTDTATAIVQKKFSLDNHALSVGVQGRYKSFNIDDIRYDGLQSPDKQTYDKESIYSLFVEDSISLTQKNLLGISLMQQYYNRNQNMKNESLTQARISYVYASNKFVSKTFAARQEFVPEPFMTAEAHVGNPQLKPEIYKSLTQEFSYKNEQSLSKLIFGYIQAERFLVPDSRGVMQNAADHFKAKYVAAEFNYYFRQKDKITLEADYTKLEMPDKPDHQVEHYNYLIRMLNTIGKFDIFNELIINKGYENLAPGYDYSAGVRYAVNPDLHISFKGENILDKGMTRKYYYNISPVVKQLEVPVIEQKFMVSLEYLF